MFVTVYYSTAGLPYILLLPFFQLLAQCLVREWRSVMTIIERESYLENTKAASFFPAVTV